jgi:hypothetical protein
MISITPMVIASIPKMAKNIVEIISEAVLFARAFQTSRLGFLEIFICVSLLRLT